MLRKLQNLGTKLSYLWKNENFLSGIHQLESVVSKILSIALIIVILVSLIDLIRVLSRDLLTEPTGFFNQTLVEIFGLFLNVLIALELLQNITAYLRKNIVQVELVIVTSLIAVARKIIIFDFNTYTNIDLIALSVAGVALSASYWLLRKAKAKD